MNFELTEEQEMLRDSVRRLVATEIEPLLKAAPADKSLPKQTMLQIYAALAGFGLTAPRLSEEAGGGGMRMMDYGLAFEALPPVISISLISHECTIARLYAENTSEEIARIIPDLVAGKRICCTGSTEPNVGSDPRGVESILSRTDGGFHARGSKIWITNGSISDLMIATCATEGARGRQINRVLFVRDQQPYEAREIPVLGLRQGHLSEVIFDCDVPTEHVLGGGGDAARILQRTWVGNRPLIGLAAVHLAQKALDKVLEYVGYRSQFGGLIGRKQLVQAKVADIATAITTSRLACYYALSLIDAGREADGASAMAKRYATVSCAQAISMAMELHGAMGIAVETGLEQLYRDARMLPIPDGTNEILTLIQARELTGLSALRV